MKTQSEPPSPISSEADSITSSSSSQSVFSKLKRKLSPRKSESTAITASPIAQHTLSLRPNATRTLSIDPNAPECNENERVFRYFDEDGDGKISPAELQSCVRTVGGELSSAEAVTAVESLDSDGDGLLCFDDFTKLMESNGEEEQKKDLREAFGMYEMEGSGCITPTSLSRMLGRLGESRTIEECKSIIRTFDLNGDGVLSFEEFRIMMR
ncbi:hypothetical protein IFM89_031826 [Coptis chinensis]|uniref:EF-hand domain-containing protein n=1 Tax=Coptis chinensis TaxID=261450 RepID=A0A835HNR0_9MAGN|nr:hypothetical protein IFM89_031826 [Coptis chinensis]